MTTEVFVRIASLEMIFVVSISTFIELQSIFSVSGNQFLVEYEPNLFPSTQRSLG